MWTHVSSLESLDRFLRNLVFKICDFIRNIFRYDENLMKYKGENNLWFRSSLESLIDLFPQHTNIKDNETWRIAEHAYGK